MLFSITIWDLLFLVLHVRSVFHFPGISIDDRHLGQLLVQSSKQPWAPSYQNAEAAAYILFYLLVEAAILST